MNATLPLSLGPLPRWRATWHDIVHPKEHGSWSLALEPVALGLIAAPSVGGAWIALAVLAGFFARRPVRIAVREANPARRATARRAAAVLAALAFAATMMAVVSGGLAWLVWLTPAAFGGALFLYDDLHNDGRAARAELAGAAAFAGLPAAFGALAGWGVAASAVLAGVMLARAVPTVTLVRAMVRGRKSGERRFGTAVGTGILAGAGLLTLAAIRLAPWSAAAWGFLFVGRLAWFARRPELRAKTIGIVEAALGAAFVLTVALSWR